LPEVLPTLADAVAVAYAAPLVPENARAVLIFSASNPPVAPTLPLSEATPVSVLGPFLYAEWLVDNFHSEELQERVESSEFLCVAFVLAHQGSAVAQIIGRNIIALTAQFVMALANAVAAAGTCGTGGVGDMVGIVEDAATGCIIGPIVNWVEVEAPEACIDDTEEMPLTAIESCVLSFLPCVGDAAGVALNALGVEAAGENLVNGVCTVFENYAPLYGQCGQDCTECQELRYESDCSLLRLYNCFDPVNIVPTVSCESLGTCNCVQQYSPDLVCEEEETWCRFYVVLYDNHGNCSDYCEAHSGECLAAAADLEHSCVVLEPRPCDEFAYDMICTCSLGE
jgi:hypothetical protein